MPDSLAIKSRGSGQRLLRGARNATLSCVSMTSSDVVTIICDEPTINVAASLLQACEEIGAQISVFLFDKRAVRPAKKLPVEIYKALKKSTISFYLVHPVEDEFEHRKELINMVGEYNLKHAHMINITDDAMQQGMLCDYIKVDKLNKVLKDLLISAGEIRVTSKLGTDVTVQLDPAENINMSAGIIKEGQWQNLPSGEIFLCPKVVDGVYYCDGMVPTFKIVDKFDLKIKPLRIEMASGKLVSITGGYKTLAKEILATVRSETNVDRIGMMGIGTNFDLLLPIGDQMQDQFVPGVYFSFGRSFSTIPTAWKSSAQYIFSGRKTSLIIDGKTIINEGRYVDSILQQAK